MANFLRSLFPEKVHYKAEFNTGSFQLDSIVKNNRNSLAQVPDWFDQTALDNSCFQYGVPEHIRADINRPLNTDLTYTDLMVALAQKYFPQHLNYLEIGVSVGKNFYQMLQAVPHGNFTGFDIEEINPVLEQKLTFLSKESWKTQVNSIKKVDSSLKKFHFNNNPVDYLAGDVWDENSWRKLHGQKYNIVFSDALHSAEAILFEFEMLVKFDLLADQFVIFWDDLHGKMKKAFLNIVRKYDNKYQIKDVYLIQING